MRGLLGIAYLLSPDWVVVSRKESPSSSTLALPLPDKLMYKGLTLIILFPQILHSSWHNLALTVAAVRARFIILHYIWTWQSKTH